jgi:hypothetical protein
VRILRVKRGYTTNSSGGNEWMPPGSTGTSTTPPPYPRATSTTPPPGARVDAGSPPTPTMPAATAPAGATGPASVTAQPTATVKPAEPPSAGGPQAQPDRTGTNLGQMGCLGGLVLFFSLLGWRLARRRLARARDDE